ncbi:MAG: IS4 family transposase, partial [Spirulinaceae cyanobacterium]
IPDKPPSIHQCVKWIAQLGGFLGRKGDGEPGVKTLWLGLQRLKDITSTWIMTRELQIEEVLAA